MSADGPSTPEIRQEARPTILKTPEISSPQVLAPARGHATLAGALEGLKASIEAKPPIKAKPESEKPPEIPLVQSQVVDSGYPARLRQESLPSSSDTEEHLDRENPPKVRLSDRQHEVLDELEGVSPRKRNRAVTEAVEAGRLSEDEADAVREKAIPEIKGAADISDERYQDYIDQGLTPELARNFLTRRDSGDAAMLQYIANNPEIGDFLERFQREQVEMERLWSPEFAERGRDSVEQIVEMRTTMDYDERYGIEENRRRIGRLYNSVQRCVNELCRISGDRDPFGPQKAFQRPDQQVQRGANERLIMELEAMRERAIQFKARYEVGELGGVGEPGVENLRVEPLPDPADTALSLDSRAVRFDHHTDPNNNTRAWRASNPRWREQLQEDEEALLNYFKHAKNFGLLTEVDSILNTLYQQIASGRVAPDRIEELFNGGIARAQRRGAEVFLQSDPAPPDQLDRVWEVYIDWARQRMQRTFDGEQLPDSREGEWSFRPSGLAGDRRETYWAVGSYPKYYQITAETPEQFLIAKETFLQMIRSGSLGSSASAIYEHVKNFIEVFSSEGGRHEREGNVTVDFLAENRQELESLLYFLVINYSKEVYNPKQAKEASEALALDEGPQRFAAAYRSGRGGVAFFTHMFDYESMMDIFNNPVGEQGEMDIVAGHFMQDTIQELAIERGMGVVLKDYDPRDRYLNSDDLRARIAAAADLERIRSLPPGQLNEHDQARLNAYRANLLRLGMTKTPEEFKNLFEGFEKGDSHIKNYEQYAADQSEPEDRRRYAPLAQLPESIRKSIDLGRIQVMLKDLRQAVIRGEIRLEAGKGVRDLLNARDRQVYKVAFDEAAANFEVAFQAQNVLGEKARRGRGFLYVDRNPHLQYYYSIADELRQHWIGGERGKGVINTDTFTVEEIEAQARKVPEPRRESFKIGWMLYKLRDGKKLDTFPADWKRLYEGLSDKEKEDVVDNIPTYKLENWIQWGVSWIKMKYADAPAKVRKAKVREMRGKLIKEARTNGYSSQLWDDFTLYRNGVPVGSEHIGYDRHGHHVSVALSADHKPLGVEFDDDGNALIFDKPKDGRLITFDNFNKDSRFPPRLITFKRPLGVTDSATGEFRKLKTGELLGYSAGGREVRLRFGGDGKPVGLDFDVDGKVVVFDRNGQRVRYDTFNKNTVAQPLDEESYRKELQILAELMDEESFREQKQVLDETVRDTLIEETVPTFEFAASGNDFRSCYTQDSYNFYQGNDRVTAFSPQVLAGKYAIAAGLSRPEDAGLLARRALVVDLTRRRTRKLPDVQQQREVTLVAAAVLESFQDRMRIRHGMYRAFLAKDGYAGRMRAGYRNEDWAGMDRFTFGFVELAAQQPLRFSRRMGAEIAMFPFEHDSGPARWGVRGVSEGIMLMADPIKNISHQSLKGQFGLTKLFAILDKEIELFNHVVGFTNPQTGEHTFGLAEKPTDNNEKMHKHLPAAQGEGVLGNPSHAIPFMYDLKECYGRLQTVTHDMRVLYSNIDNTPGALNLEEHEVFLRDGGFNTAIEADRGILRMNGIGRNRQYAFLDGEEGEQGYYLWLVDPSPGGGADVYPDEAYWNGYLFRHYTKAEATVVTKTDAFGRSHNELALTAVPGGYIKDWNTDKII